MTNGQVLRDLLLPSNPLAHLMLLTPSSPSMSPLAALNSSNMNMASLPTTPTSGQSCAQIWKGRMARIKPYTFSHEDFGSGNVRSSLHEKTAAYPASLPTESHRRRVSFSPKFPKFFPKSKSSPI